MISHTTIAIAVAVVFLDWVVVNIQGRDRTTAASCSLLLHSTPEPKMKDLFKAIERIPLHLREGYWSPVAILYLFSYFAFLVYTFPSALNSVNDIVEPELSDEYMNNINMFRTIAATWGILILVAVICVSGWWPLVSYTITSWNLLWLRMTFAALDMKFAARIFKFPSLVGCTITVTIWWTILVPLIHHLMEDKEKQAGFWKFNTSFLLLNVHLVNLPIAAAEFFYSASKLVFFDLWIALLIAFAYMMFYLGVLDARGIHLYIILTPRTHFCFISYSLILSIYYACYIQWNSIIA